MLSHSRGSQGDVSRFLIWIDSVGGFLVCTGERVTLGQPVGGRGVDVPIMADLSRHHATIRRSGEGYLLRAKRRTVLDGRALESTAPLSDGALVELGSAVRLRFRQSHPLSATGRLDFVSRHRTHPPADAVLLMADTCMLGPAGNNHIVCRDWTHDVVLYRQAAGLGCRTRGTGQGSFQVDGRACDGQGLLTMESQVVGEDFSFRLEPL